jgi:hypothetical protein
LSFVLNGNVDVFTENNDDIFDFIDELSIILLIFH